MPTFVHYWQRLEVANPHLVPGATITMPVGGLQKRLRLAYEQGREDRKQEDRDELKMREFEKDFFGFLGLGR